MKYFTLTKASDISLNEMVFLSDVSGDDRIFSVSHLPPFSLGEVISRRIESDEYFFEIRDHTGIYEVVAFPWNKFAVYTPEKIKAKNLEEGDKVLLRGNHSLPKSLVANSRPMSCVSEVLEISKTKTSDLEVMLKLARPVTTKMKIGPLELPFKGSPKATIRMTIPEDASVELSHRSYA